MSTAAEALATFKQYLGQLDTDQKAALDVLIADKLAALWLPEPENEPQGRAYYSQADLLLFGGAPGGGKTDLLAGCALTAHTHSVIFRRQATDLRGIEDRIIELVGREGWNGADKILRRNGRVLELGHLEKPGAEKSWQGRPHDFIGFDEGAQLARVKVQFVLGWLRSVKEGQRRRSIIASNPPLGGEGEWLAEWFAPWLDLRFSNPAKDGELRYAATAPDRDGTTIWLPDARKIVFTGERSYRYASDEEIADPTNQEVIEPLTRSFIRSWLRNNPYLAKTGYQKQLQSLPEPMRSLLLKGDFMASRIDHEWQIIPTAWVKAAQERWTPRPPNDAAMTAIGVDVAQGGDDNTTLAPRHGPWFAQIIVKPGRETPKPSNVAGLVVSVRRNGAIVVIDMGGGYGGGVKERLEENDIPAVGFVPSGDSHERTKDKQLGFVNKRSECIWKFREALDPDQPNGSPIALPPDPEILADLTATRWKLTARGILAEPKEDIKKAERLGRSPDKGDAIVTSWSEGEKALVRALRKAERQAMARRFDAPVKTTRSDPAGQRGTSWMK